MTNTTNVTPDPDQRSMARFAETAAALVDQIVRGSHGPTVHQVWSLLYAMRDVAPQIPAGNFLPAGQGGHLNVASLERLMAKAYQDAAEAAE
jgi:hypothetical protein